MEEEDWNISHFDIDIDQIFNEDKGMEVEDTDDFNTRWTSLGKESAVVVSSTITGKEELNFNEEFLNKFCKQVSISFFNEFGLISHQINSYNDFVKNGIQKLFDSLGEVIVEPGFDPSMKGEGEWRYASVSFGKVTLDRPTFWIGDQKEYQAKGKVNEYLKLLPKHARLQKMTYSARMKVEITVQVYTKKAMKNDKCKISKEQYDQKEVQSEETRDVVIGRIPVMVRSNLCWMNELDKRDCDFDHGGYFLIKGAEKTFIAQEERCLTRLWVQDKPNWAVFHHSEVAREKVSIKFLEKKTKADDTLKGLFINVYFLFSWIPLWILFFALGLSSDKEIIEMIDIDIGNSEMVNIILLTISNADKTCEELAEKAQSSSEGFRKEGTALERMDELIKGSKFPPRECMKEIIETYLFPSLNGPKQKAIFLAYMVKCLVLSYTGRRKCENWDDFRNKRLDLAGELLERELRVHIRHAERRMVRAMQRDLYGKKNLQQEERYLDASIITNGLNRAFSTGHWSHPFNKTERISGVVVKVSRTNPLEMMADMRKTRQRVKYTGKVGDARYPNSSHWGRLCFLCTPDGDYCGLVKNMAATGLVSTKLNDPLMDQLLGCGMEELADDPTPASLKGRVKVFLNGDWVGVCDDSLSFVADLRTKRRSAEVPHQVEVKLDKQLGEIRIFSDAGRILRPLLVVDNLKKIKMLSGGYNIQSLLGKGVIELIGVEEEEDCQTAWHIKDLFVGDKVQPPLKYTHCELDLSFLLGLSSGIIPFANHDHAKRVLYQSQKHSHQAIGFCTTNPNILVHSKSFQLYYPQRPLFQTVISDCLGRPEYFNGQNAIVAVNVHHGYNQEDSLVMNRASLERGMFRTELIRTHKTDVQNNELWETRRFKAKDRVGFAKIQSKIGRVDSLDDDGFPFIGANLQSGDIIFSRCAESGADHSIKLKHTEGGKVQQVVLSANDDGTNFAAVSLRQVRSPSLGDKFSSMHGQKGVVGQLESQENFPFTHQGVVPDIVINPHAFPTRQTPGQLLEAALGKGIACGGSMRYATPFSTPSIDIITNQLHRAGYQRWGSERVCNGETGEMMHSLIFMGPTFYQRLTRMSQDEMKFRNSGPVHPLTRQPVQDRKRFGGVRFGEMERDYLLAHGAAANLHERLFTLSDFSQMHVCHKCTHVANVIQRVIPGRGMIRGPFCRYCESAENIVKVDIPYGAKLLYQELFSMGICVKFQTEPC